MHVLHMHWHLPANPTDEAGMLLWLEDSEASPRYQGKGRTDTAKAHPFCAEPEAVRQLLARDYPKIRRSQFNFINLLLPTTEFGPQPSPQLVHDWDIDKDAPLSLALWMVSGIWLSPVDAFGLLHILSTDEPLPIYLALGPDANYWQSATYLVLETLAQQKLLPTLAQSGPKKETFQGRWMPVLDEARDAARVSELARAMPPLCRAEATTTRQALSAQTVLENFLNTMTDALARQWGQDQRPAFTGDAREPARAWLSALFAQNPEIAGSAAQLKHMYQSYRQWLRNLHLAGDKTCRVAFRLEAPAQQLTNANKEAQTSRQNWRLYFMLQARDDPSLLIPAQQVWQTRGNFLKTLDRRFEQPQEKLLTGLGYAARLFPPLGKGLETSQPTVLTLSNQGAFDFLRDTAPLLEASGFGILVPPWWNKPGTRLGVRLKLSGSNPPSGADVSSQSVVSFNNLIHYKWELSVGETTLTREEFDALVALKSPLVQIRGQWVQLDPAQIESAIRFWEKQELEAEISMQKALQMGLGSVDTIDELPLDGVKFEGWLSDWLDRFTGDEKLTRLSQPAGLQARLRPYQQYGYSWLDFLRRWGMGACLADDMGLGKTIQTIAMLLHAKEQAGCLPGSVLLICPTSVVTNWAREVERFAPALTLMIHQGSDRWQDKEFLKQAKGKDMILTSYAIARRDAKTLQQNDWFGIILDEAQNIKNSETKQAQTIRRLKAQFRLALTGTPVENRLSELWSIMQFLNPDYLGSRQSFRRRFAVPIERNRDEAATRRLRKMVSPFILRRVKTDPTVIRDLPDKQEMKIYCSLSEEQATLYDAVVQDAMQAVDQADGIQRRGLVLGMLIKLKQICNHPAQFLHQVDQDTPLDVGKEMERSGKLARLTEMLEEAVTVGDRTLIFTQFAEMGQLLKRHLQERLGVPAMFLYGGTPAEKRAGMVRRFQEDPDGPPIFVLSLKAAGTGLNLTRANHVFHFDRWWNPAVEDQATDRAFRIGQKRNVQVHKFVCVGTMEEMVDNMIESKKALADRVIGSGEDWLTEVSTEELRELVTRRQEAIK